MAEPKVVVHVVDREGNKKSVSYQCTTGTTSEAAGTFVETLEEWSGARVLAYTVVVPAVSINDDGYTPGDFDLVGESARLRFVDEQGQAFAVSIPAPIDSALDANEEVSVACALAMKDALEALRGGEDDLQYRGGRLIVKNVSNPVLIPVLAAA